MSHQTHKKILIFLLTVSIILFTGCSSEEEPTKKDTPSQSEDSSNLTNSDNESSQDDSNHNSNNDSSTSDDFTENTSTQNEDSSSQEDYTDDVKDDTPTQDEDDSSNDTTSRDKTEYHEMYAERKLVIDIDVPFEIGSSQTIKSPKHKYALFINSRENKKVSYFPKSGYIGQDEIQVEFHEKNNYDNKITITYKLDIKKPPLDGHRDFVISYQCDNYSHHLTDRGYVKNFDISIVDNDLTLLENLYDDKSYSSTMSYRKVPKYSRIMTDYFIPNIEYYTKHPSVTEKSINHHNTFKNHMNDNIMVTCNYSNGYFNLIYPIDRKEWYAVKPHNDVNNLISSRNDLYFYVSSLSELHSKIYLKEYKGATSSENSYSKANEFMDKVFPNSHYTAELVHNYDRATNKWINIYSPHFNVAEMFDAENKLYYDKITFLADEMTNGDVIALLQKIADNYESYYMSGNNQCLDSTICGTLFPEYTQSVTSNPKFEDGLSSWSKGEELASPASGKIESFPSQNVVKIEYTVDREKSSENPHSELALYQTEQLNNSSVDDYFLRFDLDDIYGGSVGGGPIYGGLKSSGFAGVYVCYKDSSNEDIGCMAWSDHTNKFDVAWGPVANSIQSSSTFNNHRLQNVIKRVRPSAEKFIFTIHLGEYMKKYMPEIYKRKDEIKSIQYGLTALEFRSKQNECYHCTSKIKANEVNLLKIK